MKIHTLEIHNIASIEYAFIDFTQPPLSDSDVFLITGDTGTGKSTILDAICLALYRTAPRLNKGEKVKIPVNDDNLSEKDPRQLMRRNTGEAFVKLSFSGTDGNLYEAVWSVQRGKKKKVSVALDSDVWTLHNLSSDTVIDLKKDGSNVIEKAVGLSYEEFCRTTMLAQGEFTKFLNSTEKEKSDILEKLTNMGDFKKIGACIFRIAKEKRKAYEDEQKILEDIKLLSEEEIIAHKERLAEATRKKDKAKKRREDFNQRISWLNRKQALKQDEADANNSLNNAASVCDSDDFKEKESLLNDWYASVDARSFYADMKNSSGIVQSVDKELSGTLHDSFVESLNAMLWLQNHIEVQNATVAHLDEVLKSQADKVLVYENSDTVCFHIKEIGKSKKEIHDKKIKKAENEERLGALKQQCQQKKAEVDDAQKLFDLSKSQIEADEKALLEMGLPELKEESRKAIEESNSIASCKEKLKEILEDANNVTEKEKDNERLKDLVKDKASEIKLLQMELEKDKIDLEKYRIEKDLSKLTVDKWAKNIRATLKEGCQCPVCLQTLSKALPDEAELENTYREASELFDKQEKKVDEKNNNINKLNAEIEITRRQYEDNISRILNDKESLKTKINSFLSDAKVYGVVDLGSAEAMLNKASDSVEQKLTEVNKSIQAAEDFAKSVSDKKTELIKLSENLNQVKDQFAKANEELNKCTSAISEINNLIIKFDRDIKNHEDEVDGYVGDVSGWSCDWRTNPEDFMESLKSSAANYDNDKKTQDKLQEEISSCGNISSEAKTLISDIVAMMPEWGSDAPTESKESKMILSLLNALKANVNTRLERKTESEKAVLVNRSKLSDFYDSHPNIAEARLIKLAAVSAEEIDGIMQETKSQKNSLERAKAAVDTIKRQLQELEVELPASLEETDSVDNLQKRVENEDATIGVLVKEETTIGLILKEDNDKRKSKEQALSKLEEMRRVSDGWNRLCNHLGDATGTTFLKIALGFVLNNLLDTANYYLRTLCNRYSLAIVPPTLHIAVEDAYQGYAKRNTTSLSGGESFLVSLALALALSNISENLAVDTLFIDEGFGTLSGKPLTDAISTLKALHDKSGRHVGIISHIRDVRESIPVQIVVEKKDNLSPSQVSVSLV